MKKTEEGRRRKEKMEKEENDGIGEVSTDDDGINLTPAYEYEFAECRGISTSFRYTLRTLKAWLGHYSAMVRPLSQLISVTLPQTCY